MFRFANEEILFGLLIMPVLVVVFLFAFYSRRKALKNFATKAFQELLIPQMSTGRYVFKFISISLALIFVIIALAGPRVGSKLKEVEKSGREIIIALDVSNSMLAEDIKPNRLETAKYSLNRLLNELKEDKIGLIVFAGDAYTQIPLTNDYGAARLFLNTVSTDMVSKQGTSIGAALELASRSFSPANTEGMETSAKSRAIIIITDGENHEDDAIAEAKKVGKKGISIHTIGLGDPSGVPIPLYAGSDKFHKDKEGNVVISKLDETTLQQIAAVSNGFYVRAGKNLTGLQLLMQKLDELDDEQYKTKVFADYIERYQYFLALGLILLLLEFLIMNKKNPWFKTFNLFN